MSTSQLSMLEVAINLMQKKKKPQKFNSIAKEVAEMKGFKIATSSDKIARLYTDMTTSSKFVYCGEETFDLKNRQKIELFEKDASSFNEGLEEIELLKKQMDALEPAKTEVVTKKSKTVKVTTEKTEEVKTVTTDGVKYLESGEVYEENYNEDEYNNMMDDYEDMYE